MSVNERRWNLNYRGLEPFSHWSRQGMEHLPLLRKQVASEAGEVAIRRPQLPKVSICILLVMLSVLSCHLFTCHRISIR